MGKLAAYAVAAVIVAGGIGGFLYMNRGNRLEMTGSVQKARMHSLTENTSLAVIDFRLSNPSDYMFQVKQVTVTLEGKDGAKSIGTILAEMDAKRFLDYYKELGPKYNDSLTVRSKIAGKETADRMVAVTFNLPMEKMEARKRFLIKVDDVDGPVCEVAEATR